MAVRALCDQRIYYSPSSQFFEFHAGDEVTGDLGEYLRANSPTTFEFIEETPAAGGVVDSPVIVGERGPELVTSPAATEVIPAPAELAPPEHAAPNPDPDPLLGATDPSADSADDNPAAFDPSDHTGPDVIAYAKAHPDEVAAILAAERAGKARTTVLGFLNS